MVDGSAMDIRLGAQVVSSDGETIGKVTHLVIDPSNGEVIQLIVRQGRLRQEERIVARSFVAAVSDDGTIRLSLTQNDLMDLPTYAEANYVTPASQGIRLESFFYGVSVADAFGSSRPMVRGSGSQLPPRSFTPGQFGASSFEVRSNLASDSLVIATGTDVLSSDGEKIGEVTEVNLDGEGKVVGFVMGTGLGNRQPVNVPVGAVEAATSKFVRLVFASDRALPSQSVADGRGLVRLSNSELLLEYHGEDVRGRAVQDRAGREIGTVEDLMVDPVEHKVRLLVVAPRGMLGGLQRKVLVPTAAVTRVEHEYVRIEFDEERMKRAPKWDPAIVAPEPQVRAIYGYYDISPYWNSPDTDAYLFPRQPSTG